MVTVTDLKCLDSANSLTVSQVLVLLDVFSLVIMILFVFLNLLMFHEILCCNYLCLSGFQDPGERCL